MFKKFRYGCEIEIFFDICMDIIFVVRNVWGISGNIAISATHVENNTKNNRKHTKIKIMVKHVEPGSKDGQDPSTDVELRVICLV